MYAPAWRLHITSDSLTRRDVLVVRTMLSMPMLGKPILANYHFRKMPGASGGPGCTLLGRVCAVGNQGCSDCANLLISSLRAPAEWMARSFIQVNARRRRMAFPRFR